MTEQKFHVGIKALIVNDKNEILVLRANPEDVPKVPDHWDLPGGRIKEGDSIEETLYREVEEELGTKTVQIIEHFDTCFANYGIPLENETVGLMLIVYKSRLPDNNQEFKLNFESLEYKWASIEEAKELLKVKYPNSFLEKLDQLETS